MINEAPAIIIVRIEPKFDIRLGIKIKKKEKSRRIQSFFGSFLNTYFFIALLGLAHGLKGLRNPWFGFPISNAFLPADLHKKKDVARCQLTTFVKAQKFILQVCFKQAIFYIYI